MTTTVLSVTVRGTTTSLDARRVLGQLGELVELLGVLEDAAVKADRKVGDRSPWAITDLGIGSVKANFALVEPRGEATWEVAQRTPLTLVQGFRHAVHATDIPNGWTDEAAKGGMRLAGPLGATADQGMHLRVIVDGEVVDTVEVTHRQSVNLRSATKARRKSLGSVTGTLASANTRRRSAGLWTDLDDRRVHLRLPHGLAQQVGSHLAQRVLVRGELTRNGAGQLLSIAAESITALPQSRLRLVDSFGIARGHLEGIGPVEYLDRAGGWS